MWQTTQGLRRPGTVSNTSSCFQFVKHNCPPRGVVWHLSVFLGKVHVKLEVIVNQSAFLNYCSIVETVAFKRPAVAASRTKGTIVALRQRQSRADLIADRSRRPPAI